MGALIFIAFLNTSSQTTDVLTQEDCTRQMIFMCYLTFLVKYNIFFVLACKA